MLFVVVIAGLVLVVVAVLVEVVIAGLILEVFVIAGLILAVLVPERVEVRVIVFAPGVVLGPAVVYILPVIVRVIQFVSLILPVVVFEAALVLPEAFVDDCQELLYLLLTFDASPPAVPGRTGLVVLEELIVRESLLTGWVSFEEYVEQEFVVGNLFPILPT